MILLLTLVGQFCNMILENCEVAMDNKRDNFKRIAENRVNKILDLYKQLGNLTNNSFYEYTNEEIEKIFQELEKELKNTKKKLISNNDKKGKRFTL